MVMKAAVSLYAESVQQEKKLLKANSETATAAKLIKEMHEMWQLSRTLRAKDEGKEVAGTDGKGFPGKYHLCGKIWHKTANCCENKRSGYDIKCEH